MGMWSNTAFFLLQEPNPDDPLNKGGYIPVEKEEQERGENMHGSKRMEGRGEGGSEGMGRERAGKRGWVKGR